MSILGNLIGGLGGKVVDAVSARGERKHQEKVRELELEEVKHKTKLEMAMRGQEMDNSWELEQIRNSGWKDEFVLLLSSKRFFTFCFLLKNHFIKSESIVIE